MQNYIQKFKMDDLISVLLPSKNVDKYIKSSIDSILNQTYQNFELIIVDDSEDDTEKIIKSIDSDKIIYHKLENSNISKSLNVALKLSRGEIIARMDADDISHPERFEIQFNYLKNHNDISLVGCNFFFINNEGNILSKKNLPEYHENIEYWMPILPTFLHATMMTYKSTLSNIMGYSEYLDRAEDIDLFFRLFKNNYKFYNIQEYLYFYRTNIKNKNDMLINENLFKNLSSNYIIQKYNMCENRFEKYDKNFRIGLLEYYHGKMSLARKYLIKAFFYDPLKIIKILRYFIFTLLGTNLMSMLREKGIIRLITKILSKHINYNSPGI